MRQRCTEAVGKPDNGQVNQAEPIGHQCTDDATDRRPNFDHPGGSTVTTNTPGRMPITIQPFGKAPLRTARADATDDRVIR